MCEEILADLSVADPRWMTMSLRYTNPSGAHPSGYIGEVNRLLLPSHVLLGPADSLPGDARRTRQTRRT